MEMEEKSLKNIWAFDIDAFELVAVFSVVRLRKVSVGRELFYIQF